MPTIFQSPSCLSDIRCKKIHIIYKVFIYYSLGPLCHLIAVPARAVGIRLLHLRIELAAVGEVVHRLEGEGGLVPGEVQREIH